MRRDGLGPVSGIRAAGPEDAAAIGRLLVAFNTEFETATPPAEVVAARAERMLLAGEITIFLAEGDDPHGLALVSFRPTVWAEGPAALLEELYVVPRRRGQGSGRALLEAVLELARSRRCGWVELNTGETDVAARSLYESAGFTNLEDSTDSPRMLYYEREL